MAYTYDQLVQMGAKPGTDSQPQSQKPSRGYTYEELVQLGATPGSPQSESEKDGIVKSIAKDAFKTLIVKPIARIGQAATGLYGLATGNDRLINSSLGDTEVNLGPLGKYQIEGQKGGKEGLKQIAGDTLKTASYLAPVGRIAGTAGKLVTKGLTNAGLSGIAKLGGGIVPKIASGAAAGGVPAYMYETGEDLRSGKNVREALTPDSITLGGAVLGGGIPVAAKALSKTAELATKNVPEKLVNYALRIPQKYAEKGIAENYLNQKLGYKSLNTAREIAKQESDKLGNVIRDRMIESKETFSPAEIIKAVVDKAKTDTKSGITYKEAKQRIANFIKDHSHLLKKKVLSADEALTLRQSIDKNLKEATFLGKELTNEQKIVKQFADALRAEIKDRTKTSDLFAKQQGAININKITDAAIKKYETQGRPGLLDVTAAGLGFAGANIPGALGAIALERLVRDPRALTATAQFLRDAGNVGSKYAGQLGKIGNQIGKFEPLNHYTTTKGRFFQD
jgi:hypothetical protein